jgi:D-alanine-D-alanine ligase
MKTKTVTWTWEDPDAQAVFAELVGFPDAPQSQAEVAKIEALLHLEPPLHVLDVGCGTGRHAIAMAQRGYHVVGIDIAHTYLERARAAAQKQGLPIEFRHQRGADLTERNTYDLALAYDHTLGFMTESELAAHFKRIQAALTKEGRLFLTLAGPKLIPGRPYERTKSWSEQGDKLILSEKYLKNGYRIERCIVIDKQKDALIEYHERQRAFALADVRALLSTAGFHPIVCLKDLDGTPATPQAFRVFVGHKL